MLQLGALVLELQQFELEGLDVLRVFLLAGFVPSAVSLVLS